MYTYIYIYVTLYIHIFIYIEYLLQLQSVNIWFLLTDPPNVIHRGVEFALQHLSCKRRTKGLIRSGLPSQRKFNFGRYLPIKHSKGLYDYTDTSYYSQYLRDHNWGILFSTCIWFDSHLCLSFNSISFGSVTFLLVRYDADILVVRS